MKINGWRKLGEHEVLRLGDCSWIKTASDGFDSTMGSGCLPYNDWYGRTVSDLELDFGWTNTDGNNFYRRINAKK